MIRDAHNRTGRAFTLLEMMIAVAVFAIVLAAINGVFWGALRLRNKTVESIDAALPAEQALAIIRNDLAHIVAPGGTFFTQLQTSVPTTNRTTTSSMLPSAALQGINSPQFTISNALVDDNTMWSDIQRVSYQLVSSIDATAVGSELHRIVTRNLLPAIQEDSEQRSILSGVESIYFSYFDGSQWQQTWNSTNSTLKLPRAIRVEINMAAEERGRMAPPPLNLVVPLIDAGTNDFTQVASTQ